jgi:hypothetical protein
VSLRKHRAARRRAAWALHKDCARISARGRVDRARAARRRRELQPAPPERIVAPAGVVELLRPGHVRGEVPGHRTSTRHVRALYPFQAESALPALGPVIGQTSYGHAFLYDAFELYARRLISSPNMAVLGQLGKGKSGFLKAYLFRQHVFGRHEAVLDVKGEYAKLAKLIGGTVVRLTPGGSLRLNPLAREAGERQQQRLLRAVCAAALGRGLTSEEGAALSKTVQLLNQRDGEPTLPDVVEVLLGRTERGRELRQRVADELASTPERLADASRDAALGLLRLCEGDLQGMFDGPTSTELDFDAPLVVLDISEMESSEELGILMTCAIAWLQAKLDERRRAAQAAGVAVPKSILVVDEAWRVFPVVGAGEWLQQRFKLARKEGQQSIVVMHRFSDLEGAGDEGARTVRLAKGLLKDSDTFVLFGMGDRDEAREAGRLLGLSDTEVELLSGLGQDVALWRVKTRSFLVAHRFTELERQFTFTDEAML